MCGQGSPLTVAGAASVSGSVLSPHRVPFSSADAERPQKPVRKAAERCQPCLSSCRRLRMSIHAAACWSGHAVSPASKTAAWGSLRRSSRQTGGKSMDPPWRRHPFKRAGFRLAKHGSDHHPVDVPAGRPVPRLRRGRLVVAKEKTIGIRRPIAPQTRPSPSPTACCPAGLVTDGQ